MEKLKFVKDYKQDDVLRQSFSELASSVFGISFEEWYQKDCWNDRYIPYSFHDHGKIVANVSVNLIDLLIAGQKKKAVQIGTVMTHPDYRGCGLSRSLLEKVLADYEEKTDVIYLFANNEVLDFYPKFGFKEVEEQEFFLEYKHKQTEGVTVRKLNGKSVDDLRFIESVARRRKPLSQAFSTGGAWGILLFYCLNVFHEHIYYLEKEEVIVICEMEGNKLHLYEVMASHSIVLEKLLAQIAKADTTEVVFHFTLDNLTGLSTRHLPKEGDALFVRTVGETVYPENKRHSLLTKA
ncbi:GNAT family N-acetyltransferase [Bacillus sp. Au-Bac7]|uniref:GNAT family N-acetyltransferase n=1 Tax=Bacillus sp. Au-Bac7 TaxID=2906458 RepID=UPI001E4B18D4|nr:GNAT family N-acetyltransferase [Bacillus sp. Au-Bac7]MCE4049652.1 GNAT family N-acetyltransferase [Bacillus sp. Au-Bac7]